MSVSFKPDSELGEALYKWWKGLNDDKGSRAELRRCNSVTEVIMTPAFQHLCHAWRKYFPADRPFEDGLAMVIGLLANVKRHIPATSIATLMSRAKGKRPTVSELRFRRLLQRERGELYPALIRILRMLEGQADIYSVAESAFYWGDAIRKRWAYDYYGSLNN